MFEPLPRTIPDDANERAATAEPSTPLTLAGLSARALSALEPYALVTVADLVAVDPVRLNRLSGVADATRREVKARARQWRDQFGVAVTGRGREPRTRGTAGTGGPPDPVEAAELLAAHAGTVRAQSRRAVARLLLGLEGSLDPFASQVEMSSVLGVTPGRVAQQMGALQDGWAAHAACRDLLDTVAATARQALADLGSVATIDELAGAVLAALPPAAGSPVPAARIAAGLLRLALDRAEALNRADATDERFVPRRRGGRIALLATDPALLDPAEVLGRTADHLVAEAQAAGEPLVPGARAATAASGHLEPRRGRAGKSRRRAQCGPAAAAGHGNGPGRVPGGVGGPVPQRPSPDGRACPGAERGRRCSVRHRARDPRPGPGQVPRAAAAARSPTSRPACGRGRAEPGI